MFKSMTDAIIYFELVLLLPNSLPQLLLGSLLLHGVWVRNRVTPASSRLQENLLQQHDGETKTPSVEDMRGSHGVF